ncbi:polysaccharide pyruvyl transferase family protein, partial [uncultured Clostridium sp.]|uniref:polysaccharide pyruvyl transferase family protein n=1 Tax=uncultured Clostridium sp. TaxID=59620 RepID=UPI002595B122
NKNEKYIFVYDFDRNELIKEIALKIAKERNLSIYTVFKCDYSDKVIKRMGPIDFISYIKNAEFVISNSFHGTAFSIIFEKQFVVVNRKEAINTRMRDLLRILNIEDRIISECYDLNNIIEETDYKILEKNLTKKIKLSKEYLKEVTSNKNQLGDFNEEKTIVCN